MTVDSRETGTLAPDSPLRTPRAAAVAGIIFAVLLATALVILELATPADPGSPSAWLSAPDRRAAVSTALNLVPFAGIAFLWFIGVVRDRIGAREDRLFATVFLGSGLLFVGMIFTAAAVAGGLIGAAQSHHSGVPGATVLALGRSATTILLSVYAMRMAAVFTLSSLTLGRGTVITGWLRIAGTACAIVLLIGNGISSWTQLVFPAWVLALSISILVTRPVTAPPP